jgi:acetylornithine deacetylase/succinyl-diaminopimelate desuccinylase-like protein
MNDVLELLESRREQHVREVAELVAIPSVSSKPERQPDIRRCAEFLAGKLRDAGLPRVELFSTPGNPIVYGEWLGAPGPTVLVYGHYDVQPEEPVELWDSPPFQATVRDGKLYGRGATDDKGQTFIHIAVTRAFLEKRGRLPLNLKFLIEGEEEVGSDNLDAFVASHLELLKADAVLVSDTGMLKKGVPSITHALRGLAYFQVEVEGPSHDLHSGSFGGAVANPGNVLCEMIAALKDADGRVTVPGFYDDVVPLRPEERQALAALPFSEAEFQQTTGSPALSGEKGYTTLERIWARPTLDVNGLWCGYQGEGAKTVLPSSAGAKFSTRLVANQDPEKIGKLVEKHLKSLAPAGVRLTVRQLSGGKPFLAPYDHPFIQAAKQALEEGFDRPGVFIREGGSIPFVASISSLLGVPCILMGFGLPDENSHAPNEHMDLENFFGGIRSVARYYEKLGSLKR